MQRLLFVVVLAVIVIGFPILISGDTAMPTREADTPEYAVAVTTNETGNSSASCTITITMTGMADEESTWPDLKKAVDRSLGNETVQITSEVP